MRNKPAGFTLIELIIVMIVLGILAATAAPRFMDFSSDARASRIAGFEGSLQESSDLVYSMAATNGIEKLTTNEVLSITYRDRAVMIDGVLIPTQYGYPVAEATGEVFNRILDSSVDFTNPGEDGFEVLADPSDGTTTYIRDIEARDPEHCQVSYRDALSTTEPALISSDTSGC